MVLVEISSHGIYGDALALDRETTIGRSVTCDVRLADHTASKLHARIVIEAEGALLRDLGISRHTLRRAIAALVTKGLLNTVPHGGNTVGRMSAPVVLRDRAGRALQDLIEESS